MEVRYKVRVTGHRWLIEFYDWKIYCNGKRVASGIAYTRGNAESKAFAVLDQFRRTL